MAKMTLMPDGPSLTSRWLTRRNERKHKRVLGAFREGDVTAESLTADGWPEWLCDVISRLFAAAARTEVEGSDQAGTWLCNLSAAMSVPVDYGAARLHLMIGLLKQATRLGPEATVAPVRDLLQEQLAGRTPTAAEWGEARDAGYRAVRPRGNVGAAGIASGVATTMVMAVMWAGLRDSHTASALGFAADVAYIRAPVGAGKYAEAQVVSGQQRMLLAALRKAAG